jgi:hypothetical protein
VGRRAAGSRGSLSADRWCETTEALRFEAIATVYVRGASPLAEPMLALRSHPATAPAQFAFDRGQLGGPQGVLALVISANEASRETLEAQVHRAGRRATGPGRAAAHADRGREARHLRLHARAGGGHRAFIAPGLLACGDYTDGPYPATLEGAVISGLAVAKALKTP